MAFGMANVLVVSRYLPTECFSNAIGEGGTKAKEASGVSPPPTKDEIVLDEDSKRNDNWDDFNHPRRRRALILRELYQRCESSSSSSGGGGGQCELKKIVFETPESMTDQSESSDTDDSQSSLELYLKVHSKGLIDFLSTAWNDWESLGQKGRDPSCVPFASLLLEDPDGEFEAATPPPTPPLIPCNFSFPREHDASRDHPQRSSKNVMGKVGYYCTDTCTPIVSELVQELAMDGRTVARAVERAIEHSLCERSSSSSSATTTTTNAVVYALCTHPGHHASRDCFGGYCYVNNAALSARLLQERLSTDTVGNRLPRVAILDVDYHCGNGTASIFYNDPTVLVVSIHCHPDFEYPFHSGFGDETGGADARGSTVHVPLLPGATWNKEYEPGLRNVAGAALTGFAPEALVISLGLDTHADDPCATRRAGFLLRGTVGRSESSRHHSDYDCLGRVIGELALACSSSSSSSNGGAATESRTIPTVVLQEGGYEMNAVPSAAADVLLGMAAAMGRGR
jgi:acetoin utilization deacetylase AcuC-like enzyme